MLQITKTGANITLTGKNAGYGDGLFWFGTALLIGAIGVAMAMSLLPERIAIGALAFLIIFSYIFNRMRRNQNDKQSVINSGLLKVQSGFFVHNIMGKTNNFTVLNDDKIIVEGTTLTVVESNGNVKCKVSGFETEKEAQVMQAILQGKEFGKRNANIRMQSS